MPCNGQFTAADAAKGRRDIGLIFFVVIFIALIYLWPLANSYFWIFDDSETLLLGYSVVNGDGGLLENFIHTLFYKTEFIGNIYYDRYRPLYFLYRVLSGVVVFLINDGFSLIMVFHVIAFIAFYSSVGVCVDKYFGLLTALLSIIVMASMPFNAEIWWWISAPELEVMFFCAPLMISIFWHDGKNHWSWPVFCFCSAVIIGFKENFVLILIPMAYLLWLDWRRKTLKISQFFWMLLPLLVAIPVVISLGFTVFVKTVDVYGVSTSSGAVHSVFMFLFASFGGYFFYFIFILMYVFWKIINIKSDIVSTIPIVIIVFLIMIGNYVFYRGLVGGFNHYGFPYQPLFVLLLLLMIYPVRGNIRDFLSQKFGRVCFIKFSVVNLSLLILFIIVISSVLNVAHINSRVEETKELRTFFYTAQKYSLIGLLITPSSKDTTPSHELEMYHDVEYLPKVVRWPVFDVEETMSDDQKLILTSDMLLVEFGSPNKRHYLGTFWNRFAYFTHPWSNPHWFRIIEHTRAVRPMAAVLADRPFLPLTAQGEAIFRDGATLYVPADHPQPGTLLLQTSTQLPQDHCWQFTVNGQKVDAHLVPQGLEITITAEMWSMALYHPQILDLELQCSTSAGQTRADLSLLALILNGSES